MKNLEQFFLFCAGVDNSILEQCPTDRNKYAGIGATVFFTGVLAFFSSSYALFTVFDSYFFAVSFGLVWGLMIFNLDRYIVMSMKSRGSWWRDAFVALPRMVIAVLLAIVISKPLELKIFEKEIRTELVQIEQEIYKQQDDRVKERFTGSIQDLHNQIEVLKTEITQKSIARDSLVKIAVQEADGTGGSKKRNLGPIYLTKKANADQAQAELEKLMAINLVSIKEKEQTIAQFETNAQGTISSLNRSSYDGFAARIDALSRLTQRSIAIYWASIFIMLLFVAVETAPIMVKLISQRSPYDYLLHQKEQVFEMDNLEKTTLLSNSTKNKVRMETEIDDYGTDAQLKTRKLKIDNSSTVN
jgi:hypothetical protein